MDESQQTDNDVTHFSGRVSQAATTFSARRSANRRWRSKARQQILDAARQELRTRSFRDVSVDELMKATGLTRTAFYRYFPDRESVLIELLDEMWGALLQAREAGAVGNAGRTEAITDGSDALASLHELGKFLADNRGILKAIADAAAGDEEVEQKYRAFIRDYWIDDLKRRIVDAQQGGLAAGLDPQLAAEALGWMAERLLTETLGRDPKVVLDTIVAILHRCIYADASPAPGWVAEPNPARTAPAASSAGD